MEFQGGFNYSIDLEEGENPIEILSRDSAGNEVRKTVVVIRDTKPPVLFVTSDNPYRTSDFYVTLEGTLNGASKVILEYKGRQFDAKMVDDLSGTLEWSRVIMVEPFDEEPVIDVRAMDMAENMARVRVVVIVDLEGPSFSLYIVPEFTNNEILMVRGTIDEDVSNVTINDIVYPVVDRSFAADLILDVGENTIIVIVQDSVGNQVRNTLKVTLDIEAPGLTLEYPRETDKRRIVIEGTTDTDVVRGWIDGSEFPIDNGTFNVTVDLDGEGPFKFHVTVEDAAGNIAKEKVTVNSKGIPGFGTLMIIISLAIMSLALISKKRSDH